MQEPSLSLGAGKTCRMAGFFKRAQQRSTEWQAFSNEHSNAAHHARAD